MIVMVMMMMMMMMIMSIINQVWESKQGITRPLGSVFSSPPATEILLVCLEFACIGVRIPNTDPQRPNEAFERTCPDDQQTYPKRIRNALC